MKILTRMFVVVMLLAMGFFGTMYTIKATDKKPTLAQNIEATYNKLANGAVIYEEHPAQGSIEDIEPAAGNESNATQQLRFRYDPLTQTYRATTIKDDGTTGQEIINYPTRK